MKIMKIMFVLISLILVLSILTSNVNAIKTNNNVELDKVRINLENDNNNNNYFNHISSYLSYEFIQRDFFIDNELNNLTIQNNDNIDLTLSGICTLGYDLVNKIESIKIKIDYDNEQFLQIKERININQNNLNNLILLKNNLENLKSDFLESRLKINEIIICFQSFNVNQINNVPNRYLTKILEQVNNYEQKTTNIKEDLERTLIEVDSTINLLNERINNLENYVSNDWILDENNDNLNGAVSGTGRVTDFGSNNNNNNNVYVGNICQGTITIGSDFKTSVLNTTPVYWQNDFNVKKSNFDMIVLNLTTYFNNNNNINNINESKNKLVTLSQDLEQNIVNMNQIIIKLTIDRTGRLICQNQVLELENLKSDFLNLQSQVKEKIVEIDNWLNNYNNNNVTLTTEEIRYNDLNDLFNDYNDDYNRYEKRYNNAVDENNQKNINKYIEKLENLDDNLNNLNDDVNDFIDDLENSNNLNSKQRNILNRLDDLNDDIDNLRKKITDLLNGNNDESYSNAQISTSSIKDNNDDLITSNVVIESLDYYPEQDQDKNQNVWEGIRKIAWIITGIIVLLGINIYLLALLITKR